MLKNYSAKTWLRFIVYSAIGIFCFFINIYIPAYQITIGPWKWGAVAGQSNVLVSHLTNLFRAAFYSGNLNIMPVVVFCWTVYHV